MFTDELGAARAQVASLSEFSAQADALRSELSAELDAARLQLAGLAAKVEQDEQVGTQQA